MYVGVRCNRSSQHLPQSASECQQNAEKFPPDPAALSERLQNDDNSYTYTCMYMYVRYSHFTETDSMLTEPTCMHTMQAARTNPWQESRQIQEIEGLLWL